MNTERTVINKYAIMNPELCEINNKLINTVNNFDEWFELCKIVCKWKSVFDNDFSFDVKSKVRYRISVVRQNLEKYLKNKINYYRRQGLEFSYIAEMIFTFTTS